jgi:hypothetical protein
VTSTQGSVVQDAKARIQDSIKVLIVFIKDIWFKLLICGKLNESTVVYCFILTLQLRQVLNIQLLHF